MSAVPWPTAVPLRAVPRLVSQTGTRSSQAPADSWRRAAGKRSTSQDRVTEKHEECLQVERLNLLNACRLAVKALVDRACFAVVDDDSVELAHFCTVFEHIMLHGYRGPEAGLLHADEPPLDYWHFAQTGLEGTEAVTTVENMGDVQTGLGKCRAWLLVSLVQKTLGSSFSQLINHKQLVNEVYMRYSLFFAEEGHLISGLLVALNSVDFCLCLKDNSLLDTPVIPVINYSYYMNFKPSAVGNLADEQEWWDAMDEDSLPHAPRDPDSSKANALLHQVAGTTTTNGGIDQVDGKSDESKQQAFSAGTSPVGSVAVEDFIQLQRHVSREREQKNYFEEMLKQRSRQLQESIRLREDLERKVKEAEEAGDQRVEKVREEANTEREQLQSIVLELHEKLVDQEEEIRRLRQQLQISSPGEWSGLSVLANIFTRQANKPPVVASAMSPGADVTLDEVVSFPEAAETSSSHLSISPSNIEKDDSDRTVPPM